MSRFLYRQFTFEADHRNDVAPLIAAIGNTLALVQIVDASEGEGVVVNLKAGMTLVDLKALIEPLAGAARMLKTVRHADA